MIGKAGELLLATGFGGSAGGAGFGGAGGACFGGAGGGLLTGALTGVTEVLNAAGVCVIGLGWGVIFGARWLLKDVEVGVWLVEIE